MQVDRTYFTWPDNVLGYDCAGCGECCKGLGIGLDAAGGQVARLVETYPALTGFLRRRGATWTAFNPRGRCWFFDADGLCRVEREHGRRVKPASCRLFPFNRVFRIGGTQIVDYNSVICPLSAAGEEATATVGHAQVLEEIESIADAAVVGTELAVEDSEKDGRELAEREQEIADACFGEARESSPSVEAIWSVQSAKPHAFGDAVAAISDASQTLWGRPWRQPTGATLANALLLTPSLRFNELFGPRRYTERAVLDTLLPGMWLAWLASVAEGSELADRPLGMQEATSIWGEHASLAYLQARWREQPAMTRGPVELPGSADPGAVVRRFGEACLGNGARGQELGQILERLLAHEPAPQRVALARMIEPLLPKLRFGDAAPSASDRRPRPRRKRRRR